MSTKIPAGSGVGAGVGGGVFVADGADDGSGCGVVKVVCPVHPNRRINAQATNHRIFITERNEAMFDGLIVR